LGTVLEKANYLLFTYECRWDVVGAEQEIVEIFQSNWLEAI
jgi:hypothetical protein